MRATVRNNPSKELVANEDPAKFSHRFIPQLLSLVKCKDAWGREDFRQFILSPNFIRHYTYRSLGQPRSQGVSSSRHSGAIEEKQRPWERGWFQARVLESCLGLIKEGAREGGGERILSYMKCFRKTPSKILSVSISRDLGLLAVPR